MELLEVQPTEIIQSYATNNSHILVLFEPQNNLNIPILIGEYEAKIIILSRENIHAKRPLTHNLLCDVINQFSLKLTKVVVESFKEGIFYSSIYISDGITTNKIDSRTSDAIALALSMNAPIYATKSVINETGIEANSFINSDNDSTIADNPTIEELEAQLKIFEQNEEYEKAAELMERINKIHEAENKENQQ